MPTICRRRTTLRLVPAIALAIVLFASAASADVTFPINFIPSSGTATGTVSFANLGDPAPSAWSFSNGAGCVYDFLDYEIVPAVASWNGNQLTAFFVFVRDDSPPCGDASVFQMTLLGGTYTNGIYGGGTYTIAPPTADAYWVGIDMDPGAVGGCDFDLRGVEPDATDIDLLLELNVDPGPVPMVTSSLLHTCNPSSNLFENPVPVGPAPWSIGEVVVPEPGGVGHVVEASVPESLLGSASQVRLVLLAETASGALDVLSTTNGTPSTGPILFSLAVAVPLLSPLGFGMLLSLLLVIGWLFSKRWGNRIGLWLILGFIASVPVVAYALDISLDGLVGDWGATSPVASDSRSDALPAGLEAEILDLFATQGAGQLSLRVDALSPDPGPVPFLVEADSLFFTSGLVTEIWYFVAPEWRETDEVSLSIVITGINAGFHEHGEQEVLVSETTFIGGDATIAVVSVNWTTDPNLTHSPETYTVCVQAMFNSLPFGAENCTAFGPF